MRHSFCVAGLAGLALALSGCARGETPMSAQQQKVADNPASMMRIGEAAEAAQDWAAAETFYRRASALDPKLASASLAYARVMARQGDMAGALASLREAHRVYRDNPAIAAALGRMLVTAKRPAEALVVFDEGLRAAPRSVALLIGKGVALDLSGRHAEAQEIYEAVIKVDPDNDAARKDLALSRGSRAQSGDQGGPVQPPG